MVPPSRSWKLRMQPTRSAGQLPSIRDSAAARCRREIGHAPDAVRRPVALDPRFGDRRMPFRQTIEIADMGPDGVRRGVYHARRVDLDHEPLPSGLGVLAAALRRPVAMVWPAFPVSMPISLSSS